MPYRIQIDERFTFSKSRCFNIAEIERRKFQDIPRKQGIYILHKSSHALFWKNQNNIFYIGAANREKLRTRIRKHVKRLGGITPDNKKLYEIGKSNQFDLSSFFVSYFAFEYEVPDYYPFLFEGYLINKYLEKFGVLPEANTGRR